MNSLNPASAARLASDIYLVQHEVLIGEYFENPVFQTSSKSTPSHNHLKASVGGRLVLKYKDGFGMCAEGGDQYKNELFLVFRGTTGKNKGADVLTDARIGIKSNEHGLPVHIGFHHCFTSMIPEIKKFFEGYKGNVTMVHCVGHSLGGAVASLAADWVKRTYGHNTKLYTFGAPRVGTDWFVKSTTTILGDENMHRVYHRTDPVPMVPLYPFMHAPYQKLGHYLFSSQPLASGAAHFMANYAKSVEGKTWAQLCEKPDQPCNLEREIEAWLSSMSPVDASSPAFWRWVDSALIYVIKKITMSAIITLQSGIIGFFTIADKIAFILHSGIDLANEVSDWVEHLMRKIMQALGMTIAKTKQELTHNLIRHVLMRLSDKATQDARNAIEKV